MSQAYSMVQECTDSYEARRQEDGTLKVQMLIPARFADLWLVKLSELTATDAEIEEYEPEDED